MASDADLLIMHNNGYGYQAIAEHYRLQVASVRGRVSRAKRSSNNNIIVFEPEPVVIPPPLPSLDELNELARWQSERDRLLATKKVIRVMHPSDRHEPFIDDVIDDCTYALMRIVQPDIVVRGSDEEDNPTISKWVAEGSEAPEITDFLDSMYVTRLKHTQRTKATCPTAIQINIEGNHGWPRLIKWINKSSKQSKNTLLRRYIDNVRCGGDVIWIGAKESIRIGKLVVMHGRYYGPNAAKKTLESRASSVSIMAGHIHDIRYATAMNDKEPVSCIISGWLGRVPVHQQENDNEDDYTTWQHATAIATIDVESGIVDLENVVFHKDNARAWFVYGGKLYEMAINSVKLGAIAA